MRGWEREREREKNRRLEWAWKHGAPSTLLFLYIYRLNRPSFSFQIPLSPSLTVCSSLVPHSVPKLSFMLWLITELTGCSGGCPWRWPSPRQPVPCGGVEHRMEGCSEGGKNGKTGLAEGHILMSRDGPATLPRTGPGNWEHDNRNTWWWLQPPQHLICR